MHVTGRGLVFDVAGRPAAEQVTFFDSLHRLRSGTWLCGFSVGDKKHAVDGTIRLCRAPASGEVWEEIPFRFENHWNGIPGSLAGAECVEIESGRLLLFTTWFDRSEPERPLFDPETEGVLHSKLLVAESADDGATWTAWRELPNFDLTGLALTGPPVLWSDGTLGLAFESFRHYDDPNPAHHAAWLVISRDGGRTFPQRFLVAQDPTHRIYYWDQRLCATETPGEFLGLFWTHDLTAKTDLPVHFLRGSIHDGVKARQLPVATTIPGQIAAPLLLEDGRILAFVVDRDRPGTMKLWQSRDGGRTWPSADAETVHVHDERAALTQGKEQIDFKQYWEDMGKWSFGHPAAQLISAREALLTYYAGPPGHLSVHWAKVVL